MAITVQGVDSLIRRLNALPKKIRDEAKKATKKNADELANRIRASVPVDSGDLRASVRVEETEMGHAVLAGGALTTKAARQGHGSYDYSIGTEFGTVDTPAQPFFWTSYRKLKKRMRGRVRRAAAKAIKDV